MVDVAAAGPNAVDCSTVLILDNNTKVIHNQPQEVLNRPNV